MPFPLRPSMSFEEFRDGIVKHYWKNLGDEIGKSVFKCARAAELPDDYAKIGSFLTDKDRVEAALQPLEKEIRDAIVRRQKQVPSTYDAAKSYTLQRNKGGSLAHLKSHKLLTNALRASEAEAGFNHEKIQKGTFFDAAKRPIGKFHGTAAISDSQGRLTSVGKEKPDDLLSKAVPLARGAPTVLGDLDPLAFNVLLRHGYQFKDVAAGAYHGEYTHRLQWYAILKGNLGLANTPLDIYRSLGFKFAKGDKDVPADESAQLWMWQALFDTAETESDAKRLRTIAYTNSGAVFNCPEAMNKSLMKIEVSDTDQNNLLWCLRVLLKTRWKKRFDETLEPLPSNVKALGLQKLLQEQLPRGRTTMVLSSDSKKLSVETGKVIEKKHVTTTQTKNIFTGDMETRKVFSKTYEKEMASMTMEVTQVRQAGYALAWYLRDDELP